MAITVDPQYLRLTVQLTQVLAEITGSATKQNPILTQRHTVYHTVRNNSTIYSIQYCSTVHTLQYTVYKHLSIQLRHRGCNTYLL